MDPTENKTVLAIDLNIRFRSSVYQLSFENILKWLVPLVIIVIRVITHFRRDGP